MIIVVDTPEGPVKENTPAGIEPQNENDCSTGDRKELIKKSQDAEKTMEKIVIANEFFSKEMVFVFYEASDIVITGCRFLDSVQVLCHEQASLEFSKNQIFRNVRLDFLDNSEGEVKKCGILGEFLVVCKTKSTLKFEVNEIGGDARFIALKTIDLDIKSCTFYKRFSFDCYQDNIFNSESNIYYGNVLFNSFGLTKSNFRYCDIIGWGSLIFRNKNSLNFEHNACYGAITFGGVTNVEESVKNCTFYRGNKFMSALDAIRVVMNTFETQWGKFSGLQFLTCVRLICGEDFIKSDLGIVTLSIILLLVFLKPEEILLIFFILMMIFIFRMLNMKRHAEIEFERYGLKEEEKSQKKSKKVNGLKVN